MAETDVSDHIRHCMLYQYEIQKKSQPQSEPNAAIATTNICRVCGEEALSLSTCQKWFKRFSEGDRSLKDIGK